MTNDGDRPTPPAALDRDAREALNTLEEKDADQLRAIGDYLGAVASWTDATDDEQPSATLTATGTDAADGADNDDTEPDFPEDVPERASVTIKEIAGTTYSYYQWRDGDRIESKTVQRE